MLTRTKKYASAKYGQLAARPRPAERAFFLATEATRYTGDTCIHDLFGGRLVPMRFSIFNHSPAAHKSERTATTGSLNCSGHTYPPGPMAPIFFGTVSLPRCVLLRESGFPAPHPDTPFATVAQKEDLRLTREASIGLLHFCRLPPSSVLHDTFSRAQVWCTSSQIVGGLEHASPFPPLLWRLSSRCRNAGSERQNGRTRRCLQRSLASSGKSSRGLGRGCGS